MIPIVIADDNCSPGAGLLISKGRIFLMDKKYGLENNLF